MHSQSLTFSDVNVMCPLTQLPKCTDEWTHHLPPDQSAGSPDNWKVLATRMGPDNVMRSARLPHINTSRSLRRTRESLETHKKGSQQSGGPLTQQCPPAPRVHCMHAVYMLLPFSPSVRPARARHCTPRYKQAAAPMQHWSSGW